MDASEFYRNLSVLQYDSRIRSLCLLFSYSLSLLLLVFMTRIRVSMSHVSTSIHLWKLREIFHKIFNEICPYAVEPVVTCGSACVFPTALLYVCVLSMLLEIFTSFPISEADPYLFHCLLPIAQTIPCVQKDSRIDLSLVGLA